MHMLDPNDSFGNRVDGLFSDALPVFGRIMGGVTKETMRSYFLWQAFLQTADLWDMPWAKAWKDYRWRLTDWVSLRKHGHSPATRLTCLQRPPAPTREEVCVGRVMRHFSHLVSHRMLREVFPEKNGKRPHFRIDHVRAQVKPPTGVIMVL